LINKIATTLSAVNLVNELEGKNPTYELIIKEQPHLVTFNQKDNILTISNENNDIRLECQYKKDKWTLNSSAIIQPFNETEIEQIQELRTGLINHLANSPAFEELAQRKEISSSINHHINQQL
jgi:hypothetical protein